MRLVWQVQLASDITLVVTSCNRHDLLQRTLDSFIAMRCGGLKPDACIIIEDGPTAMPDWLREGIHYYSANLGVVTWLSNEARMGQLYAIDRAYEQVRTSFIFHCEDDWLFVCGDFMADSKRLLEKYPQLSMVSLRGSECNGHPLADQPPIEGCRIQQPYWRDVWGGLSWNPGLRRLRDWQAHDGFGAHVAYGEGGLAPEAAISKMYLDRGFRIAANSSLDPEPCVQHLGAGRSRAAEPSSEIAIPRVLIAIPACHRYAYGRWESAQSPQFDAATAYNGKPYGTDIHISGSNDRIATLRSTWMRDTIKWPTVEALFFYGAGATREPLGDEVFLACPDDYEHLPQKTIAICAWALEAGFDYVLKVDDDTGVYVDRAIRELMSHRFDYAGYVHAAVCTGGPGYWLSRRAMRIVVAGGLQAHWAEDVTVCKSLTAANIYPVNLPGHRSGLKDHWFFADGFDARDMSGVVTFHAVRPADMRAWYVVKETADI